MAKLSKDASILTPFLRRCIEQDIDFQSYNQDGARYFMFESKEKGGYQVGIKFVDEGIFKCSIGNFGFYPMQLEELPRFLKDIVCPILGIGKVCLNDKDM